MTQYYSLHSKYKNRPIAIHLSNYIPQTTSISSILHRFSALLILFCFIGFLFYLYFLENLVWIKVVFLNYSTLFMLGITKTFLFLFFYHSLNGIYFITNELKIFHFL